MAHLDESVPRTDPSAHGGVAIMATSDGPGIVVTAKTSRKATEDKTIDLAICVLSDDCRRTNTALDTVDKKSCH